MLSTTSIFTERRAPKRNFYRRIRRKVSVNQFCRRSVSLCFGGNISDADNSANSECQNLLAHFHFSLDCPNMFPMESDFAEPY